MNKSESMNLLNYEQNDFDKGANNLKVIIWWIVQGSLFRYSLHHMYRWRNFLLKLFGANIGENVKIRSSARFHYPWKVTIGENSWIGDDVYLYSLDQIFIGNNSVISQKTYLCTGSHNFSSNNFGLVTKKIIIGDKVWIAADCFIHPGVKIDDFTLVSARSTVLNNLESNYIYAGNPAKPIKKLT